MATFFDYERITSGTDTQADASSRENAVMKAINKALGNPGTQDAVVIGNLPNGMWPVLSPYTNDNSGGPGSLFPSVPAPQFVWDDNTMAPGETRYFAHAILIDDTMEIQYILFIASFTDDAHRLFVEERTPAGELVSSFILTNESLVDGNMAPTTSAGELHPPYTWQRIRFWSRDAIVINNPGNLLVISYEVVNYNSIGEINPAGLAYVADLYQQLLAV